MADRIGKVCGVRDIGAVGVEHQACHAVPAGVQVRGIANGNEGCADGKRRAVAVRGHVDEGRVQYPVKSIRQTGDISISDIDIR